MSALRANCGMQQMRFSSAERLVAEASLENSRVESWPSPEIRTQPQNVWHAIGNE